MKIKNPDLSPDDWELCRKYVNQLAQKDVLAHEAWEFELENWAENPDRQPRRSTVAKLRLRFQKVSPTHSGRC